MKKRTWIALILVGLVGQFAWTIENMYFNVFLYNAIAPDPTAIAWMVALSAIAATVTTLLMGALSDRVGRRKPFICLGYILWGLSVMAFALLARPERLSAFQAAYAKGVLTGPILVVALDCVMTFFGSTANDACFNAWLTDVTDEGSRGSVEGINAMMPLVAILAVFGGFMSFNLDEAGSWVTIFNIIGIAVIAIGVLGIFLIKDPELKTEDNQNYFGNIFYGFRPSVVKSNPMLYFTLIALAVFNISIQIFMPYLILYYTETLKMSNYVLIFAPAIVVAAVFTGLYGKVYDRRGFQAAIQPTLVLLMAGYVVLYFCRGTALVFLGSLIMMCGYLGTGAVIGAKVRTHTPEGKSGMFQGLRIFAQVLIPGVIGPAIGAAILTNAEKIVNNDGTTSFIPNENIFLGAFLAGLAVFAVLVPMLRKEKSNA
mgnify:CR=1 FL=1